MMWCLQQRDVGGSNLKALTGLRQIMSCTCVARKLSGRGNSQSQGRGGGQSANSGTPQLWLRCRTFGEQQTVLLSFSLRQGWWRDWRDWALSTDLAPTHKPALPFQTLETPPSKNPFSIIPPDSPCHRHGATSVGAFQTVKQPPLKPPLNPSSQTPLLFLPSTGTAPPLWVSSRPRASLPLPWSTSWPCWAGTTALSRRFSR